MTTLAPNGTTLADYDPTGNGAIALLGTLRSDYALDVSFGDVVNAATVALRSASVVSVANSNNSVSLSGPALQGNWKCLGYLFLTDVNATAAATIFMRVS